MAFRFIALTTFFGVLFGTIGFNLYRLQVEKGIYYFGRAQARNDFQEALDLRRGQIFFVDKNGKKNPVALNRDLPFIYVVPRDIKDAQEVAIALAPFTNIETEELVKSFQDSKSLFRLITDRATDEEVKKIKEFDLTGVHIGVRQYRYYPYGTLAAQTLGFVGINAKHPDPVGLYGIEKLHNDALAAGEDITLTIDHNIQAAAEKALVRLVEDHGASGGTAIVQDPATGKILALASAPTFDPNNYRAYPIGRFLNPATQLVYEPGSVFKPLTMSAGIDSGKITPDTTYIDRGSVTLNGKTITNWDKMTYGEVTMTKVIERSINTGAVFAEQQKVREV